jgi:hypothetical protein
MTSYALDDLVAISGATMRLLGELRPDLVDSAYHWDHHYPNPEEGNNEPCVEIHFDWSEALGEEWEFGPESSSRDLWIYLTPKRWELVHVHGAKQDDLDILLPTSAEPRTVCEKLIDVLTVKIPIPENLPQPHHLQPVAPT